MATVSKPVPGNDTTGRGANKNDTNGGTRTGKQQQQQQQQQAAPTRPPPLPKSLTDPFVFVPITQAEAARGRGAAKRLVRAHVTRVQHAKSGSAQGRYDLQSWTVKPYIHPASLTSSSSSASTSKSPSAQSSSSSSSSSPSSALAVRKKLRTETGSAPADGKPRKRKVVVTASKQRKPPQRARPGSSESSSGVGEEGTGEVEDEELEEVLFTDSSRSSQSSLPEWAVVLPNLPVGASSEDPFWTYPVDYQPELSPIFAHYIQNVAVEIPDIDGPVEKGLLRRVWFPMCMTDASTMYAVLLMAASHYCAVNPTMGKAIDLLALKSRALSEINAALADPIRATSDSVIGAVAKMAAYEAIFGDSDVFRAHMKGLQLMLRLRGSLRNLGLNGLLERMLVWIDLNASHLVGGEKIFGGDTGIVTEIEFEAPDPFHFAGIQ